LLFVDKNYTGGGLRCKLNGESGTAFMNDHDFNDKASSWWCGSNIVAYFCKDWTDKPEEDLK